jgi:hypothetical protein
MKGRSFLAVLLLTLLSGCESLAQQQQQAAADRIGPQAPGGPAASGVVSPRSSGLAAKPDLAAFPVGAPCRIDLVRPPGQGQAYEGNIVRVKEDEIVLSNVFSEGPMKRSRGPSIGDLASGRFASGMSIDWQKLPDKEVRIAKSEISAARVLDHDPAADFYQR